MTHVYSKFNFHGTISDLYFLSEDRKHVSRFKKKYFEFKERKKTNRMTTNFNPLIL